MEEIIARWGFGVFVGVKRRSGEVMVSRPEGALRLDRLEELQGKRGGDDCVSWVKWAPWRKHKDEPDADGDVPERGPRGYGYRGKGAHRDHG